MRFASLHLRAWGPFERAVLDFDAPRAGLQIVHGPNERGKSTAMRAVSAFLFGVPVRTDDAFGRDYATLRVGAVLEDGDRRVALMRRKGAQRTLFEFDPATGTEHPDRLVEQAVIERMLGGLDERRFATMHGLGADQLREGGRSLLDSGSELGSALFEAAGGVPRLRAVAEALRRQADELFLPNGRVPPLNATIADWQRQAEAARAAGVRPRDWTRLREAFEQADAALGEVEAGLRSRRERHARLER
ncbi:MAG: AAA family ATPase, partial [Burkholderiales bacterium]